MANAKLEIHCYRRMTAWDYTRGATLFVTIVTEPRRAACLDYNAEIVDMALASHGLALYWRPDGPHFTKEAA